MQRKFEQSPSPSTALTRGAATAVVLVGIMLGLAAWTGPAAAADGIHGLPACQQSTGTEGTGDDGSDGGGGGEIEIDR